MTPCQVERFEDRTLLAVSSIFLQATGTLVVATDTGDDVAVTAGPGGEVLVNGTNPQTGALPANSVQAISVTGGQGANSIDLAGVAATDFTALIAGAIEVHGGDGADTITASPLGGLYVGGHGDDVIDGDAGNDTIDGDDGHDTIDGGDGDDSLMGGDGDDSIDAGRGHDTITGGDGDDVLNGGIGDDVVSGNNGADTLDGGFDDDLLNGGFDTDTIDGGVGNDTLFGGGSGDLLLGNLGDDRLNGNAGRDTLDGGDGNDTLIAREGANRFDGGDGNDSLQGGAGLDTMNGGDGADTLDGGDGNDLLSGDRGDDSIWGGAGNDTLLGGDGDDTLFGQGGEDTVVGGLGADFLNGGGGDDWVQSDLPLITITDVAVREGDLGGSEAVFLLTLSHASGLPITVDFSTADGTATAGLDYAAASGTVAFDPGVAVQTITIPIFDDTLIEVDETFLVNLSNPQGAALADNLAIGTIIDDDRPLSELSVNDVVVDEGSTGNAVFVVTLSDPSFSAIMVDYVTLDGTATGGQDYQTTSGTLVFQPGSTLETISIPIFDDPNIELDETFLVELSNPTAANLADDRGQATIVDDDLTFSIDDVSVIEGDAGTTNAAFTVSAPGPVVSIVTVDFSTADSTAIAGQDFQSTSGTLTFMVGSSSQTLNVPIIGDTAMETDETFFVNLSNPSRGVIVDGQGQGTIIDDDGVTQPLTLSIDDVTVDEADIGTLDVDFTVTLSATSTSTITVDYGTADGTATAGEDYQAASGTLTFPPGTTSQTITVTTNGDFAQELDEDFFVNLSNPSGATIVDGQGVGTLVNTDPAPNIFIDDVDLPEGNSGITDFNFNVRLSANAVTDVTVDFATADSTAVAGQDYQATSGTVTFPVGSVVQTVTVPVIGDTVVELGEVFFVNLSNATNATIIDSQAVGLIFNDDSNLRVDWSSGEKWAPIDSMAAYTSLAAASSQAVFATDFDAGVPPEFSGVVTTAAVEGYAGIGSGTNQFSGSFLHNDTGGPLGTPGSATRLTLTDLLPHLSIDLNFLFAAIDSWDDALSPGATGPDFFNVTVDGVSIFDENFDNAAAGGPQGYVPPIGVQLTPPPFPQLGFNSAYEDSAYDLGLDMTFDNIPHTASTLTIEWFADGAGWQGGTNESWAIENVEVVLNGISDFGPDTLLGEGGNDTLIAAAGNDFLDGGPGDDSMAGSEGNDTIQGASGKDTLDGGTGDDSLDGGRGSDTLSGGAGNDAVAWEAGDGTDQVEGGLGFDELDVNTLAHNDRITVDAADDGRFSVHHRIPSDPVGDTVKAGTIEILSIDSDRGADKTTITDLTSVENLQQITIDAGRGSDSVDASAQANPTILVSVNGGGGPDTIIGGVGNDIIDGGDRNDSLSGGGGDDTILGNDGVDKIFGGDGNDSLSGDAGRDFLYGDAGDDTLDGGLQNDDLYGGAGSDLILGGLGDDSVLGEAGHDVIDGGGGDDTLRGGADNDSILGSAGVDSLAGDDGDDTLRGGSDGDTVVGGAGNDSMFGGDGSVALLDDGDDFLNGNAGDDTIQGERGEDTLLGGSGLDELDGGFGNDQLNGNAGADSMRGGHGDDLMRGAAGNDTLNGGHGEDTLRGELGDDALSGHDGHDRINGGAGLDTLHGGDGNDTLRGGADQDLLIGHDGMDNLNGQGGSPDTLVGSDAFDILDDNAGSDLVDGMFEFVADWIDAA